MRSYKEILSFLIVREQLSLGWKVAFISVCAALLYGTLTVSHLRMRSTEIQGTVLSDRADLNEGAPVDFLTVRLDNGDTVHASASGTTGYYPGRKVIVKETTSNLFGMSKHEVKKYVDEGLRE